MQRSEPRRALSRRKTPQNFAAHSELTRFSSLAQVESRTGTGGTTTASTRASSPSVFLSLMFFFVEKGTLVT